MQKKFISYLLIAIIISFVLFEPVGAQENEYQIRLRRNFGFGGGTNIRGTFTVDLVGEEAGVEKVTFLIDEETMATISSAPYQFRFHTDDFGYGTHQLFADVQFTDGGTQITPVIQYNFVSPGEEREQMTTILVGIGGAIIVSMALVSFIQTVLMKGKKRPETETDKPRRYGLLGGTICPRCGRAFSRHIWGMNLVVGRLERCDHCGKWVMTVRATPNALRKAEELEDGEKEQAISLSDQSRDGLKDLEDTKYIDEL